MKQPRSSFARQWRWPIVIAVLTVFGLLSALIGQGGVWWWLSWAALAAPLLVVARYWPLRQLFERKTRA
ncbi:hypothetical protein RN629_16605 [Sphingomonadaceae bacterium jetA1]|jgi:hypothetical protein|uniref:hypothetical protein n=1 Tax=Facivitalis istanbulensis TaxID=3075838 RepID=UPI003489657E